MRSGLGPGQDVSWSRSSTNLKAFLFFRMGFCERGGSNHACLHNIVRRVLYMRAHSAFRLFDPWALFPLAEITSSGNGQTNTANKKRRKAKTVVTQRPLRHNLFCQGHLTRHLGSELDNSWLHAAASASNPRPPGHPENARGSENSTIVDESRNTYYS